MSASIVIIDLGSTQTVMVDEHEGVFYDQPNVLLVTEYKKWYGGREWKLETIGMNALIQSRQTPSKKQKLIAPLQAGRITDTYWFKQMLEQALLSRQDSFSKPRVGLLLPYGVSATEKKRFLRNVAHFGHPTPLNPTAMVFQGNPYSSAEPLQAALYLGSRQSWLNIYMAETPIAFVDIEQGGTNLNNAIIAYLREHHLLTITDYQAEHIKQQIGSLYPMPNTKWLKIVGKRIKDNLPKEIKLVDHEIRDVLTDAMEPLLIKLMAALRKLPAEILTALSRNALYLVGGGAQLYGVAWFIEKRIQVACQYPSHPPQHVIPLNALHWFRNVQR